MSILQERSSSNAESRRNDKRDTKEQIKYSTQKNESKVFKPEGTLMTLNNKILFVYCSIVNY